MILHNDLLKGKFENIIQFLKGSIYIWKSNKLKEACGSEQVVIFCHKCDMETKTFFIILPVKISKIP